MTMIRVNDKTRYRLNVEKAIGNYTSHDELIVAMLDAWQKGKTEMNEYEIVKVLRRKVFSSGLTREDYGELVDYAYFEIGGRRRSWVWDSTFGFLQGATGTPDENDPGEEMEIEIKS